MSTPKNVESYEKAFFDIVRYVSLTGKSLVVPFPTEKKARGFILRWNGFRGALKRTPTFRDTFVQACGILRSDPLIDEEGNVTILLQPRDNSPLAQALNTSLQDAGWNPNEGLSPPPEPEEVSTTEPTEMQATLDRLFKGDKSNG